MMKLLLPFLIFGTTYAWKREDWEWNKAKIKEVTNGAELPLPNFLCETETTPSDFIGDGMTPNGQIIKLGIQIDNFSGYTLKNPLFHPYYKAIAISNATKLGEVLPHRTEFIVVENYERYYVHGSISWEIFLGGKYTELKMFVKFSIPW